MAFSQMTPTFLTAWGYLCFKYLKNPRGTSPIAFGSELYTLGSLTMSVSSGSVMSGMWAMSMRGFSAESRIEKPPTEHDEVVANLGTRLGSHHSPLEGAVLGVEDELTAVDPALAVDVREIGLRPVLGRNERARNGRGQVVDLADGHRRRGHSGRRVPVMPRGTGRRA